MPHKSADPVADDGSRQRRAVARICRWLTSAIAAGVIVRLSVLDRSSLLAPLFYALPLPILAVLAVLRIACLLLLQQRCRLWIWVPVTAAIVVWCVAASVRWHAPQAAPQPIRILCWNVARGGGGWRAELAETLNRERPDIAGLIEAGGPSHEIHRFWTQHCPGYRLVLVGKGLLCLTRGTAEEGTLIPLANSGFAGQVSIDLEGRQLTVLLVDIHSHPFRSRATPLAALAQRVDNLAHRPVVIMGDFNTPPDSVHFEPLRALHREAFETAGRGYAPTWPIPFPVLHLDQVWTNRHVQPLRCEHRWTSRSDHRPVIADVSIIAAD